MLNLFLASVAFLPIQLGWRNGTPSPILDGDPEYLEIYWKAWENAQSSIIEETRLGSLPPLFLGPNFAISFDESVAQILYLRWAYQALPLEQTLQFVLSKIASNGQVFSHLNLETLEMSGTAKGIPLTGLALWSLYQFTGKIEFLRLSIAAGIRRHALFQDAYKSVTKSRCLPLDYRPFIGTLPDEKLPDSAEATSLLLLDAHFLMRCADVSKIKGGQSVLNKMRDEELIRLGKMWDTEAGFYRSSNKEKTIFEPISIIPIWAIITEAIPSSNAETMLKKLSQPDYFSARMPYPSVPASYAVSSPINPLHAYFCIRSLLVSGKRSEAGYAAESMLSAYVREAGTTKTLFFPFNSDTRAPTPLAERNSLQAGHVAIGVLLEAVLGFEVSAEDNLVTWSIWRTDRHGIERLRFGTNNVSLVCSERASRSAPIELRIEAEKPFLLRVKSNSYDKVHKIQTGINRLNLG